MLKPVIVIVASCSLFVSACVSIGTMGRRQPAKKNETIVLNEVKIIPKRTDQFRTVPVKLIDILHTDIEVSFNWGKHECTGKETLLVKPYFYETDSIILDAKNMIFSEIVITDEKNAPVQYQLVYDKVSLRLKLERTFATEDSLKIVIRYTAKPDEIDSKKGMAIRDDKGLYFINTDHKEPNVPVQLWTQGESESSSCWFPTVDNPNEKFTMKLAMVVNKELTTLSNGKLVSSVLNGETRTDTWISEKPIPAYLVMMTAGNFVVTKDFLTNVSKESYVTITYDTLHIPTGDTLMPFKDSVISTSRTNSRNVTNDLLNGVEVSYYLEAAYAPYAKNIFRHTPEMIRFFSEKLGVPYPWNKYSQIVVRDFVSGAMENTSATVHNESVQKNNRELLNAPNDDIISHELFHQWFGDLATCRSWSHLILNEGFTTYGEQLWLEYKYGDDAALAKANSHIEHYLNYADNINDDPIIQFNYKHPDDMFSPLTYQKGSAVLNLLRAELGDQAFFLALKNYLNKYAYQNAEIDDLRKEFENVSGKDLRNFFSQWFYKGGHPVLELRYDYNDTTKLLAVTVEQKQARDVGLFSFPLVFKVTQAGESKLFSFDISKRSETFFVKKFDNSDPEYPNVFVDPEATFIGSIKDNKPFINYIKTYTAGGNYIEKVRSLKGLNQIKATVDTARAVILSALNDTNPEIRGKAIDFTDWTDAKNLAKAKSQLVRMASADTSVLVRTKATAALAKIKDPILLPTLMALSHDSSYSIASRALDGIYKLNPMTALSLAADLKKDARRDLFAQVSTVYANAGMASDADFFEENLMKVFNRARAGLVEDYTDFALRLNKSDIYKQTLTTLQSRAENDRNAQVRVTAIVSMNAILQRQLYLNETTKNPDAQKGMDTLKTTIQGIIDQEQNEDVINLLNLKGLTQTHDLNEDR